MKKDTTVEDATIVESKLSSLQKWRPNLGGVSINKFVYRKISKNWDTKNNYCDCPKNGTIWFHNAEMRPEDADGAANSIDPDQTAPWSGLIRVYTVCSDLSVPILRVLRYTSSASRSEYEM